MLQSPSRSWKGAKQSRSKLVCSVRLTSAKLFLHKGNGVENIKNQWSLGVNRASQEQIRLIAVLSVWVRAPTGSRRNIQESVYHAGMGSGKKSLRGDGEVTEGKQQHPSKTGCIICRAPFQTDYAFQNRNHRAVNQTCSPRWSHSRKSLTLRCQAAGSQGPLRICIVS